MIQIGSPDSEADAISAIVLHERPSDEILDFGEKVSDKLVGRENTT
jgi:hypothetical protein